MEKINMTLVWPGQNTLVWLGQTSARRQWNPRGTSMLGSHILERKSKIEALSTQVLSLSRYT